MASFHFTETQRPRQVWLWIIILGSFAMVSWGFVQQIIMGKPFGDEPAPDIVWYFLFLIPLAMVLLFAFSRLETEIDDEGVHYRYFPFQVKLRHIAWEDLERVWVRKYNPILEYGGWGLRTGFFRKASAINMSGNMGVQFIFKSGRKLLLGTNSPEEIRSVIRKFAEKKDIPGEPA